MRRAAWPGAALLAVGVAAGAGCGLGPGDATEGEATLTVTRDYGTELVLEASEPEPSESETVIRLLDREAEIETRYGGGFVQSVEGLSGGLSAGRSHDWFFFVNGIESPVGAAEAEVRGGDRVWWDYRDWTDAMRTPAVVGSWPEPFAQASAGTERLPVRVECRGAVAPCKRVAERLSEQGADASIERAGDDGEAARAEALRLLVGPWPALRADPVAAELDRGPRTSGVFARFERTRDGYGLIALDERARPVREDDSGAGLVAALRRGEEPPTWLVTGTDPGGVAEAAEALDAERLAHRYALFTAVDADLPLPAQQDAE